MNKILIKIIFMIAIAVLIQNSKTVLASVRIENKVNANSNTGGNLGPNVETGDAKSKSSVKTKVDNDKEENFKIETSVKAEANDLTQEVQVQGWQEDSVQQNEEGSETEIFIAREVSGDEQQTAAENDPEDGILTKIYLFIKNLIL
jgi:hypothetical protein